MVRLLMATTVPVTLKAFLLPFARHFRSLGWTVDAMANGVSQSPECLAAFDHVIDMPWSRNPLDPRNLLGLPGQIEAHVRRGGYDLVHVHTPVASFVTRYALRARRQWGGPALIYTAHGFHFHAGGNPVANRLFLGLEQAAGRWTDYLVTINHEDEAAARRYGIVRPDRVRYMPGIGVDTAALSPGRVAPGDVTAVRAELGLGPEEPLFLMVAEFNPGKRHRDALRAFAALGAARAHLAFAGNGPLLSDMERLARELGVAERVHFLGFRRDIPALIRASVATLLPSEREGLPRSVMESLALSVLVIGADIRGIRDLLGDGCGLLVPVGDVPGLAGAMRWILEHPQAVEAMGREGRQRMSRFDLSCIIESHERLYAEALGVDHAFS